MCISANFRAKNMRPFFIAVLATLLWESCESGNEPNNLPSDTSPLPWALVIHGGAGTIDSASLDPELEKAYRVSLDSALQVGAAILSAGGTAMDAVETVIRLLEDDSLFNAGRGAVLDEMGQVSLDAAIMDGHTGLAGAIAGSRIIRHPIQAARSVMEKTEHVLLSGAGADAFALHSGIDTADPGYFITRRRRENLQRAKKKEQADSIESKSGTVGAVALDRNGQLVAGTSTGGMTNKRWHRIGDSPLIGAGTYADQHCAISCTGHGEYFIRHVVAYDVAARMKYKGESIKEAGHAVIHDVLFPSGGLGGLIGLDHNGNITMPFNTSGMYRGYITPEKKFVAIYLEDEE